VTLRNTLVGENVDSGNEAPGCIGSLTSNNYNLLSGGGCTFDGESGDLIGYEPRLGALQGDGPQTHGLLPDSPAIDAGDPAGCTDDAGAPLTTDQRKAPRPSGSRCDIGAFEANAATPAPNPDARCFSETGYCISGRIREFWEQNGGLPVFGYPTSPQQPERVEANIFQVQHFERNRLELHPENQPLYDVLLGRLGAEEVERLQIASLPEEPLAGCLRFAQTQHIVCDEFAQAWQRDGLEFDGRPGKRFEESLALFGLPITGRMTITLGDGKRYQVQYFERTRFEYHPENAAPYNVLFGLLDNEAHSGGAPRP
jgi:hypothetical protein